MGPQERKAFSISASPDKSLTRRGRIYTTLHIHGWWNVYFVSSLSVWLMANSIHSLASSSRAPSPFLTHLRYGTDIMTWANVRPRSVYCYSPLHRLDDMVGQRTRRHYPYTSLPFTAPQKEAGEVVCRTPMFVYRAYNPPMMYRQVVLFADALMMVPQWPQTTLFMGSMIRNTQQMQREECASFHATGLCVRPTNHKVLHRKMRTCEGRANPYRSFAVII